jgi:hypothetical protein
VGAVEGEDGCMSRNVLRCGVCKRPLLHTRRNGRIKIVGETATESVAEGMTLYCRCGARREYTVNYGGDSDKLSTSRSETTGARGLPKAVSLLR